jgi:hypothetical protein
MKSFLGLRWKYEMPIADRVLIAVASLALLVVSLGILLFIASLVWALFP